MHSTPMERLPYSVAYNFMRRCLMRVAPVAIPDLGARLRFSSAVQTWSPVEANSEYPVLSLYEDIRSKRESATQNNAEHFDDYAVPAPQANRLTNMLEEILRTVEIPDGPKGYLRELQMKELEELSGNPRDGHASDAVLSRPSWPNGPPSGWPIPKQEGDELRIRLTWDVEAISRDEYKALVVAIGDLVRAHGANGIQRVDSRGYEVPCPQEVAI